MTIQLNEPVVTTLRSRLETELPAIVTAINATVTDGFTIDAPQRVLDYIPPVGDLNALPLIGISDGEMILEDDTGWGATGVFDISVVVYLQSSDQRVLAWQLRRYAQALVRAIRTPTIAIGEGWGVYNFRVRPGPTLGRDESPRQWLSTIAVTFTVKTEQDS